MTLSEASKITKRALVMLGVLAVLYYIFLLLFLPGVKTLINAIFPEKDPPNPIFGMLPPLQFTTKITKGDFNPSYKLDTATGRLPKKLPHKMRVYQIRRSIPSFEKGKDAKEDAADLGFYDSDLITSLKEPVYKWRKLDSNGLLEIDTNNRHLSLGTSLNGKSQYYPTGTISKQRAIEIAIDIFKKIGRYDDLYEKGTKRAVLGRFVGISIQETDLEADAQIARVDFFRNIDDFPILGPDPKRGMLYTFLRKPQKDKPHYNYPVMEGYLWDIIQKTDAIYPIVDVETAWNQVKNNKGILVSVEPEGGSKFMPGTPVLVEQVFINNIYLAYYERVEYEPYLQPIYVFEGKYTTVGTQGGTVVFYYPAIAPEYIKTN